MSLTEHTKQQLSLASRSFIAGAMGQLPVQGENVSQWLMPGQRYEAANISGLLRKDAKNGTIDSQALAQRMAASVPSHVLDGWSLFGRAVHCLLRGDTRTSVHLGYYAELRAVLAIVASEGIGIFDRLHFVIDEYGSAHRLCSEVGKPTESGTHSMIWPIYSWWIDQPAAHDLIKEVIRPGSRAIGDWFNVPEDANIYLAHSARAWLIDWGLDLNRMNRDFWARNASSYGPSALHGWQTIEPGDAITTVTDLWRVFEPADSSRFDLVDRLFLRRVLLVAFNGQTSRRRGSKNWHREFGKFVDGFLDDHVDHHLVQVDRDGWKESLVGNGPATPLDHASKNSPVEDAFFPVELLARAGLLLRLASGSCAHHMAEVGITWASLLFWLNDIGIKRGLWDQNLYPENAIDLWSDIEEVLDTTYESSPLLEVSRAKLEECERIGMWGFGV